MSDVDVFALGVSATTIIRVFSWGFGVVLLGFMMGYIVGVFVSLIKRI